MANETVLSNAAVQSSMTSNLKVAKNTFVLVALRVLMPAVAVGLVLMLSRYLGAEGLGRYTLAFSFLYLFSAIAPLGLGAIITRDGARDRGQLQGILNNSLALGTIAAVILTGLMSTVGYFSDYDLGSRQGIILLSLALVPCTIGIFQDSAFIALERMDYLAWGTFAEYVIKVGLGIVFLLLGYGLNSILILAVIGRIVGCIISAILLRRLGFSTQWAIDRETSRKLLKLAPTFLLIGIFATLYWRIDIFMLSKLQPVEQVGYYGAAWRILELAMVLPQSLCLALYPQISASALSNLEQLRRIGSVAMRYLFAISIPAAIGVTLLAEPILKLLYGDGFHVAANTLTVLILTLIPYGVVRYHAYVLVGANHQRIDLVLNIVMSVLNIAMNLILIPKYGHLGAAIATFISICVYAILQYSYLLKNLPGWAAPIFVPRSIILASVLMTGWVWHFRDVNLFLTIVIAILLYGSCLVLTNFFSDPELKLLGFYRIRQLFKWSR